MEMRYKLPELMEARGWTAYRVAKETGWAISTSTVHRLAEKKGRVDSFDGRVVEALMRAFAVGEDFNQLLQYGNTVPKKQRKPKPSELLARD